MKNFEQIEVEKDYSELCLWPNFEAFLKLSEDLEPFFHFVITNEHDSATEATDDI